MEQIAEIVARIAFKAGKFAKDEHAAVLKEISALKLPDTEKDEMRLRVGNVSQLRQELEKAGVITNNGALSAWCRALQNAAAPLKAKMATLLK